ncbi:MAG: DnaB-like helicase C-terminal domain-containing protein, partial [Acutalibacteraceae bacterium]
MQGLQRVNELVIQTFDRLDLLNSPESDMFKGVPTGIKELDDTITGLNRSDLILLAARPGMGKTSFALNIMRHAAVVAKKRVAFFSLEMSKEQLASRLLSTESMVSSIKLRTGKLDEGEWMRLIEGGDILSKTQMYFDDSSQITVPEMKAKLRRLKDGDLVIIDYLQLMSGSRRTDNRVQEISEITRNLKIMAKELMVPVITLSQLSRDSEKRTTNAHRPVLSDLRDSGSIEQDADIVLFLYRDDYYSGDQAPGEETDKNRGECIIAKNRHGETKQYRFIGKVNSCVLLRRRLFVVSRSNSVEPIVLKVKQTLQQYQMLVDAKPIVVGFSGGADSMMLLHLLHQMQLPVLAAHVHHGLRGVEADRDEKAAELFCEKFKIPLEILHTDVQKRANQLGIGIEECGRDVRSSFF